MHTHPSRPPRAPPCCAQIQRRVQRIAAALAEEVALALRGLYLFLLFLPAVLTSPVLALAGRQSERRAAWLELMRWTLERAGPAFIKWGQWAATRPDMFPADVCAQLALLQTCAPTHGFDHTRGALEAAFGQRLEALFDSFEEEPVASGSIAQVGARGALGALGGQAGGAAACVASSCYLWGRFEVHSKQGCSRLACPAAAPCASAATPATHACLHAGPAPASPCRCTARCCRSTARSWRRGGARGRAACQRCPSAARTSSCSSRATPWRSKCGTPVRACVGGCVLGWVGVDTL